MRAPLTVKGAARLRGVLFHHETPSSIAPCSRVRCRRICGRIHRRWPGFRVPETYIGVFEKAAGYLRVERCVLTHIAAAKSYGSPRS